MAKPKVFISHISKETELAQMLKKHLAKDFLNFFEIFVSSDGKTILPGRKWLDELSDALEEAQVEIVLCSKESVGRPWVNFEAGAGWIRDIPVIPLCHSGLKPNDLPVPLSMLQAIEAGEPDSLQVLYETIASRIDMQAPAADFKAIADEAKEIEKKYRQAELALERVEDPLILCAASEQYAQPDLCFELDAGVLEKSFPGKVNTERKLTSRRLRNLLTTQQFDIIHLVLAVDANTGDLLFSPIDFATYKPNTRKVDRMPAEGFANLVLESQTRLIVLATCNALSLGVEVARITNMIATSTEITGEAAAEWGECFYDLLAAGYPLYKAFDLTKANINAPMRLIRQKDIAFAPEASARNKNDDKVTARFNEPQPNEAVGRTIRCSGVVNGLQPGLNLWLAVEVGGLIFPKESKVLPDEDKKWCVPIFEDGANQQFAVSLFVADASADRRIKEWLEAGRLTGKYSELRGIPGARRLARVDGLRLKTS